MYLKEVITIAGASIMLKDSCNFFLLILVHPYSDEVETCVTL